MYFLRPHLYATLVSLSFSSSSLQISGDNVEKVFPESQPGFFNMVWNGLVVCFLIFFKKCVIAVSCVVFSGESNSLKHYFCLFIITAHRCFKPYKTCAVYRAFRIMGWKRWHSSFSLWNPLLHIRLYSGLDDPGGKLGLKHNHKVVRTVCPIMEFLHSSS